MVAIGIESSAAPPDLVLVDRSWCSFRDKRAKCAKTGSNLGALGASFVTREGLGQEDALSLD